MKSRFSLALLCALLLNTIVCAQSFNSYRDAVNASARLNKPILILLNFKMPENVTKTPRNFIPAIEHDEVKHEMVQKFVVYETNNTDTSVKSVIANTHISSYPAYLFLHSNGEIFYKDFGNHDNGTWYFNLWKKASLFGKEKPLSVLEKEVAQHPTNTQLIKSLIDLRRRNGITTNAELADKYYNSLNVAEITDGNTILYILEAEPYVDGNTYRRVTHTKAYDSLLKVLPYEKRVSLYTNIINNTMREAIKTKNLQKARAAASVGRSTWGSDFVKGDKVYNWDLMRYFGGVKDTANYLKTAAYYYDNFILNINKDSVLAIDQKRKDDAFKKASSRNSVSMQKVANSNTITGTKTFTRSSEVISVKMPTTTAGELNNAAWRFFEYGTKDLTYLSKAMVWSRKSIELEPLGQHYDTLAQILYRMGYYAEAEKTQKIAIVKVKAEGHQTKSLKNTLKKIKSRTL